MSVVEEISTRLLTLQDDVRRHQLEELRSNNKPLFERVVARMKALREQAKTAAEKEPLMIKAKVGETWKARCGDVFEIKDLNTTRWHGFPILMVRKSDGAEAYVDAFGKFDCWKEDHQFDMVECLHTPPVEPVKVEPKIEQQPICACCSTMNKQDTFHDDPCIYTSDERGMKPAIKAMFRETQHRRTKALIDSGQRAVDLQKMEEIEDNLPCAVALFGQGARYSALVGRKIDPLK